MSEAAATVSSENKRLGIELFNKAWGLIEKPNRSPDDDAQMLHLAHASVYHWSQALECSPNNLAVGEWQVSHVLTLLGHGQSALYHAQRSLDLCETHSIRDFAFPFAHEAIARSAAAIGDQAMFARHFHLAKTYGSTLSDVEDRKILRDSLCTGPWFGALTNMEDSI